MLIKNCTLLNGKFVFEKADMRIEDDKIKEIAPSLEAINGEEVIDAGYKRVIPGLIDIHTHGSVGHDTCDGSKEALSDVTKFMAENGITSYLPTTMTLGKETLKEVMKTVSEFMKTQENGCTILGVNMEGPYFSMAKKGAQNGDYIMDPDFDHFKEIYDYCDGIIKIVGVAPELPGAIEFIKKASELTTVSIGHTNGKYEDAKEALDKGATHCVHLYNGMPGYNHRDPGIPGAIIDGTGTAELICDGIHINQVVVRNTFRAIGEDRLVLISDSMRACGMTDGEYELGGQPVFVKGPVATLKDGTLAGSATCLMGCVRKAYEFGIPLEKAIKCASLNPAKAIKEDTKRGSLVPGKIADVVILNDDLSVEKVVIKGKIFK